MKKFIVSMLSISVFFIGLGALVENAGAKFKSDERALGLISQARTAIGGDAAINGVQSLSATGKATKTFNFDGNARSEQGDWELNLQLPNKISKMMKVNVEEMGNGEKIRVQRDVVTIREGDKQVVLDRVDKPGTFVIKRSDKPNNEEVDKIIVNDIKEFKVDENIGAGLERIERNDLFRTTLSLLLSAPQGTDVSYKYAGEGSVDGASCDIIEAGGDTSGGGGGSPVKLYLDKSTHLPRMISFMSHQPVMMFRIKKDAADAANESGNGEVKTFSRKLEAPQMAEFQIKFSDYRAVNGLLLPHRWVQTVAGNADETVEISSYEINPANIAEKFNRLPQKIMIRTEKMQ